MVQKAKAEINKFVGGFVSDASPLTYPDNTASVDINMELSTDGSRKRSKGIDLEPSYAEVTTTISSADSRAIATKTYRWENVGGDSEKIIACVQIGNEVKFFDTDITPLSSGLIDTYAIATAAVDQIFSFAAVDGNLVIASGISDITIVEYSAGVLTYSTDIIRVRDFFGMEDITGGVDLTTGSGLQTRPTTLSNAHQYNLRNQSFGISRLNGNTETLTDPIYAFYSYSGHFPSNSDAVSPFLYADANDPDDRNSRRYFPADAWKNPLGNTPAAQGYFVIDLLNRGASRQSAYNSNQSTYGLSYPLSITLPADQTPGGATVIGQFAGRIWYGGFDGAVIDGDTKSPHLSSYIAFSQLVTDPSMITQCYQSGDPTSDTSPDIIDTDGGYIRLNNAYGVSVFVNLGSNLIIGAKNGIWRVYGTNNNGFTATSYMVEKITDKGIRGPNAAVQVENTLVYWSDDGIYWLKQNQFGDWVSTNQTQTRIQNFYNEIPIQYKEACVGVYDGYQRKVRWLYQNLLTNVVQQKELVFDINLNAFYERHISQLSGSNFPILVDAFNTNVFRVSRTQFNVTAGGVQVTSATLDVTVTLDGRTSDSALYNVFYVAVTALSPVVKYSFAYYNNFDFVDWYSVDNVGVDAPATLVTGIFTGGDNTRYKQVPYLMLHMIRTEDGFTTDVNGDFVPIDQSSCNIQSMWDWTNSANSNKWGTPFEGYRYKRVYFPVDVNDTFDVGYQMLVTKNKLRGRGRALSLKFTSSAGKEMHIVGWSLIMTLNNDA